MSVEKLAQGRQAEESEVKLDYLMAEEWAHSKAMELYMRIQKYVPRLHQTRLHWQQMYPYTQHCSFHFHARNKFRHHMNPVVFVWTKEVYISHKWLGDLE